MATGLTLDSGALIAVEERDRGFTVLLDEALERQALITLPAPVLAQVWRGNSPLIARLIRACEVEPLGESSAKATGELLAKSRTADVIDAVVVLGAIARGDAIVTSDPGDIAHLLAAAGAHLSILAL